MTPMSQILVLEFGVNFVEEIPYDVRLAATAKIADMHAHPELYPDTNWAKFGDRCDAIMSVAIAWYTPATLDDQIRAAKRDIDRLREQDYCNERSDDFYYTNGGKAAMARQISKAKSRLAELTDKRQA